MNDSFGGSQPAFKERWDLASHHETKAVNTANRIEASEVILQALKIKRKTETAQWLSGLEKEVSVSNNKISSVKAASSLTNASGNLLQPVEKTIIGQAISWLDRMFVEFELYASQFNLSVRGTNLVVSCTRPIKRSNDTGGLYSEANDDCLSYAGHIATQLWALVVRGCATKVEVFIIPSEFLLGLSVNSIGDTGYEPLLVIEPAWQGEDIIWHIQGNIITADQIPSLAKELFGDLIKVASGKISESELVAPKVAGNTTFVAEPLPGATRKLDAAPISTATSSTPASMSISTSLTPSLESIKVAGQLLTLVDRDINHLIELGKQALESDDSATFEQVKLLSERLEALKKTVSIALGNIYQSITK